MADVTGPISSLPGSIHAVPEGVMCDEHPTKVAVTRIQGETDSFGSEMIDLCQECIDARSAYRCSDAGKAERDAERNGVCDWCGNQSDTLSTTRDYDEGMSGPLYKVCSPCRTKRNQEAESELADHFDDDNYFPPHDDDGHW